MEEIHRKIIEKIKFTRFITDLRHDQLIEFHRNNYHPSKALFYLYGILFFYNIKKGMKEMSCQI